MATTATTGKILVGWIEYDIDDISVKTGTTYPDLGQITKFVDCGSNCVQGQLVPRSKIVNTFATNYSPYEILQQLVAKRTEYAEYSIKAQAVVDFNAAIIIPNIFDSIFSGKLAADVKVMPTRPSVYSGDTFLTVGTNAPTTSNLGGYGAKTSGMYSLYQEPIVSGWKPFGTMGQGREKNMGIDNSGLGDKQRVMLITTYAVGTYD